MIMKKQFLSLYIGVVFLLLPFANFAQIQVVESEISDSTQYSNGIHQDSIFIIYKGENNKSAITLIADLNDIDSLNYDWYTYDSASKSFKFEVSYDTVRNCTIAYSDPGQDMNDFEGGYRLNIHNQQKGIDTTFTIWIWYQDFFINSISVYNSTCKEVELRADTSFQDLFVYYDLSEAEQGELSLDNNVIFSWISKPDEEKRSGIRPRFTGPTVANTYTINAEDGYGYTRESSIVIDEDKFDSKGYPYLRAVDPLFSGIHGLEVSGENDKSDSIINVEAPYGVWFFNESKNAEEFEWVFYNHIDWMTSLDDTTLHISTFYEPMDSIYYKRPKRNQMSPEGYDVKLSVWGPVYNDDGDVCDDTLRKENFVIVDTTQFPNNYIELPNVFTPDEDTFNDNFWFVSDENATDKPVKSIQKFSIKIYSRWGNKVYEYEDEDGSWEKDGVKGWDGTTRVGTKAKQGVYYYTILATGWDGRDFKVGGFVHIFY